MLGGVTKLHTSDELTRRRWLKSFVEGPFRMGVQIITDDNDLRCRPIACPQEVGHLVGPVHLRTPFAHCDVPPAHQRVAAHKNARGGRTLVFIVHATRMLGRPSDGCPHFLQELDRLLIHAEHRIPCLVGLGIDLQHFLHTRCELGIGGRRNDPIFDLPGRKMIFFKVLRRVSWLTDSTSSNATACAANKRSVQLANPGGGGPSRKAMILASCIPSSTFPRTRRFGLPCSVISKPSVTKRSRMFSMVCVRPSNALAIAASVQCGPSASALSSTWERSTFCAATRRCLIRSFNIF